MSEDLSNLLSQSNTDIFSSSVMRTVNWRANDPELRWLSRFDWASGLYYPMIRKFWDCFFYGDFEHRGKEVFQRHYEEVRSMVPADNLLEYRIGSGWEPLCEFLGAPVPETPFPHTNDTSNFVNRCRTRNRNQILNVLFRTLVVSIPIAFSATIAYQQFVPKLASGIISG
jgi:hypothetical protein